MKEKPTKTSPARKHALRRLTKLLLLLLVGAAVIGAAFVAAMPRPVEVELVKTMRGALVVTVNEDGRARVKDRYVVSAPLAGNLTRIELRAGDEVKQGQVLARIVPLKAPLLDARAKSQAGAQVAAALAGKNQARAQVERAKATLSYASKEVDRARALFEEKAISHQEMDRTLLEVRSREAELTSSNFGAKVADHKLRMARAALGHYNATEGDEVLTVTSPVSGRVLKLIQQSEGVLQAGTPLLEVGDPSALEVVIDVLTSDAVRITPGNPVTLDEWGGDSLAAVVRLIEPSAFSRLSALGVQEQRVNAVIDLTGPYTAWVKLGDGYRVEAHIEVFREKSALLVPQSAVFRAHDGWAVFVLEQGRARLRKVQVGRRNDTHVAIQDGLNAGEFVVIHPSDKVDEGVELESL